MSVCPASAADTNLHAAAYFSVHARFSAHARFSIHARAEPGVMPRVLELFAKRGLVPTSWHSAICGTERSELKIDIRMGGLDRQLIDYIAACLRQIAFVDAVLASPDGSLRVGED